LRASAVSLPLGLLIASAGSIGPALAEEAAEPYPAQAVLDAFRDACSDLASLPKAEARVAASGWTRATDPYATPVGELVRFGYEAGEKMVAGRGKVSGQPAVFTRTVAGEDLYLVLSSVELEGTAITGCRAYHPAEERKIDVAAAARWVGREPDRKVERAELAQYTWQPGYVRGQDSFEVYHVPADSPVIAITKLSGIALKADRVGSVQR
jgi:hypothetical protein